MKQSSTALSVKLPAEITLAHFIFSYNFRQFKHVFVLEENLIERTHLKGKLGVGYSLLSMMEEC